jgi:MFS family permease
MVKSGQASELRSYFTIRALCSVLASTAVIPLISRPFSLYRQSWRAEFGWNEGNISLALSILGITFALSAPLVGALADRYQIRDVVRCCGAVYSLGFISVAFNRGNLPLFYTSFFVLGLSAAGVSQLIYSKLLAQWFTNRLGTALGSLTASIALAAILTPLITQIVLDRLGWRACWIVWGTLAFFMLVFVASVLPGSGSRGLNPPVRSRSRASCDRRCSGQLPGWQHLLGLGADVFVGHLSSLIRHSGSSPAMAAMCLSLYGAGSLIGRLIAGMLLDRVRPLYVIYLCIATSASACAFLQLHQPVLLALGCSLLGYSSGSELDIIPYLVRRSFGVQHMAGIAGSVMAPGVLFASAAIGVTGHSFDVFGSYKPVLIVMMVSSVPAACLAWLWSRLSSGAEFAPPERVAAH